MKTVLFLNTEVPHCGVHQYGRTLFSILEKSINYRFVYREAGDFLDFRESVNAENPAATIFNWYPDIGGWQKDGPFDFSGKQLYIYHDWQVPRESEWDAILFSDPTFVNHDNWHRIPRPIPLLTRGATVEDAPSPSAGPVIGVHGFYGAYGEHVVKLVMENFAKARVRMHLPYAHYGDTKGETARMVAAKCLAMANEQPGIVLEISHHWMTMDQLLVWLSNNDINCYIRDTETPWRGVSSALDAALGSYRPIAVNRCPGFRHVHHCKPSICIEDRTLSQILATGTDPLLPLFFQNRHPLLVETVEEILDRILG